MLNCVGCEKKLAFYSKRDEKPLKGLSMGVT